MYSKRETGPLKAFQAGTTRLTTRRRFDLSDVARPAALAVAALEENTPVWLN